MKMCERNSMMIKIGAAALAVLIGPGVAKRAAVFGTPAPAGTWQGESEEQSAQDREQEARDREQERRDREQEARDREQEKKDREQERLERLDDLYDEGREALDEDRYDQAAAKFRQLADLNGPHTDAALYWKAYSENKLARKDSALATIADFKKRFPQSKWMKDLNVLELDVKQSTGSAGSVDADDEELKMLAIRSLMNSDPQRAMPLLEKILNGPSSPKEKSQALFVLAQNGSQQSRDILGRIAKGESNPDLQRKAVQYLGLFGGKQSHQVLAEVYSSTTDESVKRQILKSYMIGGDKEHLFAAAKGEKNESLRIDAIRQLGLVHGVEELRQLYQAESSPEVKKTILQAFFLSGDAKFLSEAAQGEKDPEVRRSAIHNLGLIGSNDAREALLTIYGKETDRENKEAVLNALFIQGNAHALVQIARGEKDRELKRVAVQKLSLMNSKEGNDFLMEILQK